MLIYKLLFRIDFELNFEIIDSAGKILSLLQEMNSEKGKEWPQLGESFERRGVSGNFFSEDENHYASIVIEPNSIVGQFEILDGIEINDIEKLYLFEKIEKSANLLRKRFDIEKLKRTGVRLYNFGKLDYDKSRLNEKFSKLIDTELVLGMKTLYGGLHDLGIAFNMKNEDGTEARMQFGPHANEFPGIVNTLSSRDLNKGRVGKIVDDINFMIDLDIYEKNHTLSKTMRLMKWFNPSIVKAKQTEDLILSLM